jgi:4-amino-4-deoxy-L-arabinose transferase-like glycosyltransferase
MSPICRPSVGGQDVGYGRRSSGAGSQGRRHELGSGLHIETASSTPTTAVRRRTDGRRHGVTFTIGLALIALAGLGIRLSYVLAGRGNDVSGDGAFYFFAAHVMVDGGGYVNPWNGIPTAVHPPAWPVLLGVPAVMGLDTVLVHQVFACVVGTMTVVLVGLAGRVVAGGRVGLLAAAIAAANPNMWVRERELAAETLVLPLAAVAVALAYRYWRAPRMVTLSALGAVCGVLVLVHSGTVLLLVFLLPPLVARARSQAPVRRLARLAAALAVVGAVLLPWMVRNTVRFERPVLLTTNFGLALHSANCPRAYEGERIGSHDPDAVRPYAAVPPGGCNSYTGPGDESEIDAALRARGFAYMREHAERLPAVVAAREGRTWALFRPLQQARFEREFGNGPLWVYQVAVFVFWALAPLAAVGALRLRRTTVPLFPLLSFLVAVAVVVAMTFGAVRYRALAEVPIVVLAAVGLEATWARLRGRGSSVARNASTTSSVSPSVMSV